MTAVSVGDHQSYLRDVLARQARRRLKVAPEHSYSPQPTISGSGPSDKMAGLGEPGPSSAKATKSNVVNYVPEEETIRNDYTAWYGVSGQVGANYILGARDHEICEEYPALRRLMDLKAVQVAAQAHPPLYLQLSSPTLSTMELASKLAPHRFDVILVHPQGSWNEIMELPIRQLSADPGFVFLWVGRGDQDGLEKGRECLARWGFRRAEDIVWIKTNRRRTSLEDEEGGSGEHDGERKSHNEGVGGGGLFSSQKEHCLMGIRGTVRRSTDTRFVHCNVDTDVMIWEPEDEAGSIHPPYLYTLIESFCLGTCRLQLFAPPSRSRQGWVTVSTEHLSTELTVSSATMTEVDHPTGAITSINPRQVLPFESSSYRGLMAQSPEGRDALSFNQEIDALRPKSPVRRGRGGGPAASANTAPHGGFGGTNSAPPSHLSTRGSTPSRGPQGISRGGARGGHMGHAIQSGQMGPPLALPPHFAMTQHHPGHGTMLYDQYGNSQDTMAMAMLAMPHGYSFPGGMYDPRLAAPPIQPDTMQYLAQPGGRPMYYHDMIYYADNNTQGMNMLSSNAYPTMAPQATFMLQQRQAQPGSMVDPQQWYQGVGVDVGQQNTGHGWGSQWYGGQS
ncbi:MT-A70-domain-containing protein [Kockovaella imperatae]|uniref:MT-A70-domain-containing protein n=1 Tax=Kockovaella imperatae TaxID=4999 RepID=A0A1Y1UCA5_9TREE|nr:MT-A70-domain-containing protein [Kockovaella imperatae]ORX35678.1 MT-A70-domain-containing protein [Kockovaella imperatae]